MRRNPNWKFYPLTGRSKSALARIAQTTGTEQTTLYLRRANNKRKYEARARIEAALKILLVERRLITISELARRSGCTWRTVKRHADIWGSYFGAPENVYAFDIPKMAPILEYGT